MPVTALIPYTSPCRICGHPIHWTHSYVAARRPPRRLSAAVGSNCIPTKSSIRRDV